MAKHSKRLIALILAIVMVLGLAIPAGAATNSDAVQLPFTESSARPDLRLPQPEDEDAVAAETPEDDDIFRVSIILEDESTLDKGYSTYNIANNKSAMNYRESLKAEQEKVEAKIEKEVLGGEDLDVVWNLTLAANLISANVEYGQIEAIKEVKGVKDVVIEMQYTPAVVDKELPVDPQMATSTVMTGASTVWSEYTGAGSLVAVIDTGIDDDHQSFDAGAYEYSLAQHGKSDVDKLEKEEVLEKLELLNIADLIDGGDAEQLYLSSKVPFAFNYVDEDFDINHDNDSEGEHGSHVTGIAAANDYIPVKDASDDDAKYEPALTSVYTQGVAPDAQIITMKVFGKGGGAYDSDYMVAIEDAMLLGADSINLSLGSAVPGLGHNDTYAEILNKLTEYGAVVTMSAGNSGNWAENTYLGLLGVPYLYADDVNMQTGGSPASYTNSLAVASVDNIGSTGYYFTVGDTPIFYTETFGGFNNPLSSLAGEKKYVIIKGIGTEEEFAEVADELNGNIAVCYRGEITFVEKIQNAVANGAIATIIVNNQPGSINMDLSDYKETQPAVSITYDEGELFWDFCDDYDETSSEMSYATGTIEIAASLASSDAELDPNGIYTMSDFSSWGIPGTLEMKPEITAPGGNIYSVNGAIEGGEAYENMSGTSMASPQVAGMAAVIAEYVEAQGLLKKTDGLTQRQLIQSLLMSTAEPIFEDYDEGFYGYYSILTQGAGLANVNNAVNAPSYIIMDKDANSGATDGKVKVELGEVFDKTFTYSFTIHDISGEAQTYELWTDIFTQDKWDAGIELLDTWTVDLDSETTYSVGDTFTVPANGNVTVEVTVEITDDYIDEYVNGAYIEGFTYVIPENSDDGAALPAHSIPILGFYGNWSDPSMFDRNSYVGSLYGDTTIPYLYDNDYGDFIAENYLTYYDSVNDDEYIVIGNPYGIEEEYPADKVAIRSTDMFTDYYFSLIRNGLIGFAITDENGKIVADDIAAIDEYGAFYYESGASWQYTEDSVTINVAPEDIGLVEGDRFTVSAVAIPEYYTKDIDHTTGEGIAALYDRYEELIESGALGHGAFMSTDLRVDDTAPELIAATKNNGELTVKVTDNQYIAYMALMSRSGMLLFDDVLAPEMGEGEEIKYTFDYDVDDLGDFALVVIGDYAGNESYYTVRLTDTYAYADVNMDGITDDQDAQAILDCLVGNISADELNLKVGDLDEDGRITSYDAHLILCSLWEEENAHAGEMYASVVETEESTYASWMQIDKETAETNIIDASAVEVLAAEYVDGYVFQILADGTFGVAPMTDPGLVDVITTVDLDEYEIMDMTYNYADGQMYLMDWYNTFYTINPLNGAIEYAFSIDVDSAWFAIDGDGNFYAVGEDLQLVTWQYDGDEDVALEVAAELSEDVLGDIAYDRDEDVIYMVEYFDSFLRSIDPATGEVTVVGEEEYGYFAEGLYIIPNISIADIFAPVDDVESIVLDKEEADVYVGTKVALTANVLPWNLSDRGVTWSSSDEAVATVNANGVVTGVGEGTATITATTNATNASGQSLTVTCEIEVLSIELAFNGLVWDENGEIWWSEINTAKLPEYKKLTSTAANRQFSSAAVDLFNEVLFAATWEGETINDATSSIYVVDPTTFDSAYMGSDEIPYTDMADTLGLGLDTYLYGEGDAEDFYVVATYGPYVLLVNAMTGEYESVLWKSKNNATLVGIAYAGSGQYSDNLYYDAYYMIDTAGNVHMTAVLYGTLSQGLGFYTLSFNGLGDDDVLLSTGISTDIPYFNSLYYVFPENDDDSAYIVWSRYSQKEDDVDIILIDDDTLEVAEVGSFPKGVWPVGGLMTLGDASFTLNSLTRTDSFASVDKCDPNKDVARINMNVSATEANTIDKNKQIPVKGGLNSVSVGSNAIADKPASAALVTGSEAEKAIVDTDANTVTIKIYADDSTNALLSVNYDAGIFTLVSAEGLTEYHALNTDTAGKVAFDFAAEGVLNQQVAEIVLSYDEKDEKNIDTEIVVTVNEESANLDLDEKDIIPIDLTEDVVPGEIALVILSGADQTYVIGSNENKTIRCNGDLNLFVELLLDGVRVDKSNYTLSEGSTIVTLKYEYLNTLAPGKHKVTLVYTYGSIDTTLTVVEKAAETPDPGVSNNNGNPNSPMTGAEAGFLAVFMLILFIGCGVLSVYPVKRRREGMQK